MKYEWSVRGMIISDEMQLHGVLKIAQAHLAKECMLQSWYGSWSSFTFLLVGSAIGYLTQSQRRDQGTESQLIDTESMTVSIQVTILFICCVPFLSLAVGDLRQSSRRDQGTENQSQHRITKAQAQHSMVLAHLLLIQKSNCKMEWI